jgi:hypothetical protein
MKLYMFRTFRLSIIRSLFTVHSAMVYVIQVCRQLSSGICRSCSKSVYKPVWHIPLLSIEWMNSWWWTDELSEICRVSWQNKFVKLVHLFGFITKKDAGCNKSSSKYCPVHGVCHCQPTAVHLVVNSVWYDKAWTWLECSSRDSRSTLLLLVCGRVWYVSISTYRSSGAVDCTCRQFHTLFQKYHPIRSLIGRRRLVFPASRHILLQASWKRIPWSNRN